MIYFSNSLDITYVFNLDVFLCKYSFYLKIHEICFLFEVKNVYKTALLTYSMMYFPYNKPK